MRRKLVRHVALGAVCSVAVLSVTVGQTVAATKKTKEPAPVVVAKPINKQSRQGNNSAVPQAGGIIVPTTLESQSDALKKHPKSARIEPRSVSTKRHRPSKVHRRRAPEAMVQPRTDLMYHGMLESPQRYDPRRSHLGTGVPDPHNPELTHDHFQELDRNQDGAIDPVERTFGRLDMDRDLHNRRPR